jgi:hypothetical protein
MTRRALVLRSAGFAVAVALGVLGVWLIVTGHSQRSIRLGALASLWALLLGTFVMFGSRRAGGPDAPVEQHEDDTRGRSTELARLEESAAQRAYEQRLEQMLRREIQASVAREMAYLRGELASLRTDLLDKVGGQIALERIETTRIIGSDLEALQEEVRQLRERALLASTHTETSRLLDTSAPRVERPVARPVPRREDVVDAELVEPQPAEPDSGYRGRRRRDDEPVPDDDAPTRRGRHSPEGEELLARLLSRRP